MNIVIKNWFKYFLLMSGFGIFLNFLYLSVPLYLVVVYDKVLFSFSGESLFTLTTGLLFVLLFFFFIDVLRKHVIVRAGYEIELSLTSSVIREMNRVEKNQGDNYRRGLKDLRILREAIAEGKIINYFDIPWILVFLGVLFCINIKLSFIAFSGAGLCFLIYFIFRRYSKDRYTISDHIYSDMNDFVESSLKRSDLVSGLGMEKNISDRYTEKTREAQLKNFYADNLKSWVSSCINLIGLASSCLVYCYAVTMYFDNRIGTGALVGVFIIAARIFYPLEKIMDNSNDSVAALGAFKRLKHFIKDNESRNFSLPEPKGAVSFENVMYSIGGKPVLKNINFSLEPGESMVIVGNASAGKTVLSRLALGIVDPVSGKIRIDGAEINQWNRDELGKHTGYLPGRKSLFKGRVDENIAAMAKPDSDKVVEASKKAFAHDMILKLSDGYNTLIEEDGKNLSSSQIQVLSIARALYNNPKFVVMDTPHSDMDDNCLRNFLMTMKILKEEKVSLILISDRPAIAVNCDKALILQDGQVSLYGPSKEVLNKLSNS